MATLYRSPSFSISVYPGDHLPPHFHVRWRDGREALVHIANLKPLVGAGRGKVPDRQLADALTWASANRSLLLATWEALNP